MVNRVLNLSLNELRLIAGHRNISDYENKSTKNLMKALWGSRPRLRIKKNKFTEIKEDFYNLSHKFSRKDAGKYRKRFYDIANYRYLSELEIEEIRKSFNRLEKSLNFSKPCNDINIIHYEDLNSDKELNVDDADDDKYKKLEVLEDYFKSLIEIIINQK